MATVNKDNFQKKTTAKKERTKLSSVVTTGKVEAKKPSIKSKLADVFLSEERGNVGQYLIFDVLIPAIKDTVCNLGHAALDRSFYGESRRYTNQSQSDSIYSYSSKCHTQFHFFPLESFKCLSNYIIILHFSCRSYKLSIF